MTSYFNNALPLYASEAEIASIDLSLSAIQADIAVLQSEISTIGTSISGSMLQFYKTGETTYTQNLTNNAYNTITGFDNSSGDLPSLQFTNLGGGVIQYNGPDAYFQINYQLSASLGTNTDNLIFYINKTGVLLPPSKQIQKFFPTAAVVISPVSGSVLVTLQNNDTISLQTRMLALGAPEPFNISTLNLTIFKIAVV